MIDAELLHEMSRLAGAGETFALATLVETRGSTPQKAGARLLVRADGGMAGTLGGGCIESEAYEAAREALRSGEARLLRFELTEDIAVDYGLACGGNERILVAPLAPDAALLRALIEAAGSPRIGALVTAVSGEDEAPGSMAAIFADGEVAGDARVAARVDGAAAVGPHDSPKFVGTPSGASVFIEPLAPPTEVIVVGGGHVGRAVAKAAKFLGHRVAVIDDRPDFASAARFPDADTVVCGEIEEALLAYPASQSSAIVIVTRGHKYDYQATSAAARSPAFYVGLMGSRRKVALIYRQLAADGVSAERLRDIHAPIGLDIGAVTPEEIALSILAEITKVRLGGDGASLKADDRIIAKAHSRAGA